MNNAKGRQSFFLSKISQYHGELNDRYDGLSYIDGHLTHIDTLTEHEATGFYLGRINERKIPFFALKDGDMVGIGQSYGHAADNLLFQQIVGVSEDDRITEFVSTHENGKLYPVSDLRYWFRRLTGACYGGVEDFMQKYNLHDDDVMSLQKFVLLTQKDYPHHAIEKLKDYYFIDGESQMLEDYPI